MEEATLNFIEPLLERVEAYGKTNFELFKFKSLDKSADITSTVISRLLLFFVLAISILSLNIAIAFWLGNLLGETYYGFLLVALFYSVISIGVYFIQPFIKARFYDLIIKQMFN
jgi:hypothetical protein